MAGDWIKMRTDLYRDPKVITIAEILMDGDGDLANEVSQQNQRDMSVTRNVMRNVTVGALVTVWGVTRHQGKRDGDDATLRNAHLWVLDEMVDLPGFGDALASVGWVIEEQGMLRFPRFFELHNVDPSAEQQEKNKERQRRYRERKRNAQRNVTVTSFSNAREEKSREENNSPKGELGDKSPPSPNASKKTKKRRPTVAQAPPSVEVVAKYCRDRGNTVDAEQFVDHYTSKGWMVGKSPMRDWKAAVRTWERNEYGEKRNEEVAIKERNAHKPKKITGDSARYHLRKILKIREASEWSDRRCLAEYHKRVAPKPPPREATAQERREDVLGKLVEIANDET